MVAKTPQITMLQVNKLALWHTMLDASGEIHTTHKTLDTAHIKQHTAHTCILHTAHCTLPTGHDTVRDNFVIKARRGMACCIVLSQLACVEPGRAVKYR
ncbi:hypothetical protein PoB_001299800 [Plakobranchus ocellatus]|uniref:Uncharacterized protein n=1 Tax=Plakobranchus ocellatus TaxID=259542 RepID=A0AAV3YVA2_9GAST|nr:hypothetical protein PoB_001299800 [Plakobranchus ocellatus]